LQRSQAYWFLSSFYLRRPDSGFLTDLRRWLSCEASRHADETLCLELRSLEQALGGQDFQDLDNLAIEYTRLFGGIREGYGPPPPLESLYRESRLAGNVTTAVEATYVRAGLPTPHPDAGPPDHLGAELKFMSLICYEEIAALDANDLSAVMDRWKLEETFLDAHLLAWVPAYCSRLREETSEQLYLSAASLTEYTILADRNLLGDLVESVSRPDSSFES
jgi:TorA maturation chaperone TorD